MFWCVYPFLCQCVEYVDKNVMENILTLNHDIYELRGDFKTSDSGLDRQFSAVEPLVIV